MKTKSRCAWVPPDNPLYIKYHDCEWGVPVYDDKTIFEFLTLEAAQAGLSWLTILKIRHGYQKAFANFDAAKVAAFTPKDLSRLIKDKGIIRNKLKIQATINNAKRFLEIKKKYATFSDYIWSFTNEKPIFGVSQMKNPLSTPGNLSKKFQPKPLLPKLSAKT